MEMTFVYPIFCRLSAARAETEAAATVEYEFRLQIGIFALNVALDDALAQVDGSGQVVGFKFAVFAHVDENEPLASHQAGL